ncbi:unnamed protein product [Calypogeia fissa]
MEESAPDGSTSSHFQQRLQFLILSRCKLLEIVGARWWKYVVLGLVFACLSSLLFASPSLSSLKKQSWECEFSISSVISLPGMFEHSPILRSIVSGGDGSGGHLNKRRQLIVQEGDYENVLLIDKGPKDEVQESDDAAALLREAVKEADSHAALEKVANGDDEDYENVALIRAVSSKEFQSQLQDRHESLTSKGEEDLDAKAGSDEQESREDEIANDGKAEHTGVEKILDRLEESVGNEEDGRFNKTISEQEGVLETVARVGGRAFDDEEEEEPLEAEKEALRLIDSEILGILPKDGTTPNGGEVHTEISESTESDVTWLDRIMGQSDPPHKPPLVLTKDSSREPGKNLSLVLQKKNYTREKMTEDNAGYHQLEDVPRLIDREDNEYVISNPGKNRMMLQEDLTLISDIVMVLVAAALGGTICGLFGQPVILGYLVAGMVVGPGGLHLVRELVQVETLAQFGVVFLLFVLGVEFNPSKMHGIHNVTLGGGCLQIGTAMLLGGLLSSSIPQGVFIGAFLSMSSTAVVVKCLMESKMGSTEHGQIMLGTLILQDCALGLLLAIMPALAAKGSDAGTFVFALSRAALLLLLFCGSAWVLAKIFVPWFLRALVQLTKFNSELFLLGAIGICLSLALISQSLGLSLEVGAFVGGLVLSGDTHAEKTLHQVEPIRNVFAALFLSSIGMVMNPIFLWEHIDILLASLAVVFLGKTFLFAAVVRAFGYSNKTSVSVGVALAQIGEFAFILLGRAQGLGLLSKKSYLLLMGTSALSLVLTPFAFKIVVRMNPPGQVAVRNSTSKSANSRDTRSKGEAHHGFSSTSGLDGHLKPVYWSHTYPDRTSLHDELPSDLSGLDKHVESMDMEGGRADRPSSPPRVVLRRPYTQAFSGKWNEWKKALTESEFPHQKR